MAIVDIRFVTHGKRNLTRIEAVERLLAMMARWWDGWPMARIGREHGISRQRVGAVLATVGCSRALWRRADHDRPDSGRRALPQHCDRAREALLHPLARRLTTRQRAALAWQAQGLALTDIARRMRTTPQNVRCFRVAARMRLDRLGSVPHRLAHPGRTGGDDIGELDWSAALGEFDGPSERDDGAVAAGHASGTGIPLASGADTR